MDAADQKLLESPPEHKLLPPPAKQGHSRKKILFIAGGLLLLLLILFLVGYLPRRKREKIVQAAAQREAQALPSANAVQVRRSPAISSLLLPGSIAPLQEAYVYGRANGYVRRRLADIGDRVQKGQILAEIDAPDLDAQVDQARATLSQAERQFVQAQAALENAQAQEELARVTWQRYSVLVQHGAVSRQDADTQLANYKTAQANVHLDEAAVRAAEENVRANRANLEHMIALQSFELVRAPFTGVITARNFDVGALVSASGSSSGASSTPQGGTQMQGAVGNAGASGAPSPTPSSVNGPSASNPITPGIGTSGELYRVAQIDIVRILVNVPQENAPTIRLGQSASLFISEFSKHKFEGKVTRTTNALDPVARTMLTEVDLSNRGGLLMPGMYAQVQFSHTRAAPALLVPGDSIVQTANGLEVAVLLDPTPQQREQLRREQEQRQQQAQKDKAKGQASQQQGSPQQDLQAAKRIHLQKVEVGRDYGPQVEVTSGLEGWEYVVVNPGDEVQEGALVEPRAAPANQGEANPQRQGSSDQQPSSIGAPHMPAPTQAPPTGKGGKGDNGGKGDGNQGKGSQKGGGQ